MANISAKLSLNVPAITALCKGEPGKSILNGTGVPSSLNGNDGDFFLDTVTYQMYGPRTGGIWGTPVQLNNNFLAPKWNSSYDTLSALSGSWVNTNTTVLSNSARWSGVFSTTRAYSGDWNNAYNTANNVYTLVNSESAGWGITSNVFTTVNTNSANWNTAYTAIVDSGDNWQNTYSTVYANSAQWNINFDTGVRAITGNWQNTYSTVYANSAQWNAAAAAAGADVQVRALTGRWESNYNNVNANSGRWIDTFTSFNAQSANNRGVFSVVRAGSAAWNDTNATVWAFSGSWGFVVDTARYDATYTTVRGNSALWGLADFTVACSDETTDLVPTSAATTFRAPYAMYLNSVRASVNTAPVGSTIIIDISAANTSIFSTKLSINQDQDTSVTASIPAVISNPNIADDARIRVAINQVGSAVPGAGLKVTFKGYRV